MRWVWLLLVLLLGGLFWWGMQRNPKELPSVLAQERRPAPDFTLPLLPPYRAEWGEAFRLADHLGKKPILLNFWASWCYPACYEEAPVLEALWRRHRDQVLFLGVNTQDKEADALRFVAQFGLTFPQVYDPRGRVGVDYGMYGVPETFLIDREGRVVKRHAGAVDEGTLEALLQEVTPPHPGLRRDGGPGKPPRPSASWDGGPGETFSKPSGGAVYAAEKGMR